MSAGWRVAVVWECALRGGKAEAIATTLVEWLQGIGLDVELAGD